MTFKNAENIFELKNAFEIISNLDNSYPNFYDWYWNKVVHLNHLAVLNHHVQVQVVRVVLVVHQGAALNLNLIKNTI